MTKGPTPKTDMTKDPDSAVAAAAAHDTNTHESNSLEHDSKPLPTHEDIQSAVFNFLESNHPNQICRNDLHPIRRLSEGCHHIVFSIGTKYILHMLPNSSGAAKSYQRDRDVTMLLKKYISRPEIIAVPSVAFRIGKWLCAMQHRLEGVSLEECPAARNWEVMESGLVDLLAALRSVPYEEAMRVLYYEHERPNLRKRVAKAVKQWNELKGIGYVSGDGGEARQALAFETLQGAEKAPYQPVLIHGDLSMQHILVDETHRAVTGLIDWSDAMLGDPCEDIAGAVLSVGAKMARRIASQAGYDDHTIERGILFAKCLAVEDLHALRCGTDKQPPENLLRAQFRMAFEETELVNRLAHQ